MCSSPPLSTPANKRSVTEETDETVPANEVTTPVSPDTSKIISPKNPLFSDSKMDILSRMPESLKQVDRRNINCAFLYNLIIGQEVRLFKVEEENTQLKKVHGEEISAMKLQLQNQEKDIELLRSTSILPTQVTFVHHMEREFPQLSEGCATIEQAIQKLKVDMEKMCNDIENFKSVSVANPETVLTEEEAVVMSGSDTELMHVESTSPTDINLVDMKTQLENVTISSKRAHRRLHLEGEKRDQYSRREILRVTGVPYKQGEDTTQLIIRIANSLGVYITPNDISVSHRSGRRIGGNSRPILAKFVRRDIKNLILANKKLAGNIRTDDEGNPVRIFIDEELTSMRAKVCKKLRAEKTHHYTRDGKVFIATGSTPSGAPVFKVFDMPQDWEALEWSDHIKTEIGINP